VPVIAIVDGMRLILYFKDHGPPHFHVELAEFRAKIDIETLTVTEGGLPRNGQRKVIQWAESRREKLLSAWAACRGGQSPGRIE
jgi:hypothetical protein